MSTKHNNTEPEWLARDRRVNLRFWQRFGGRPDFRGAVVLDLGCGHGSLCVDVALAGARHVTGLDVNAEYLAIARQYLIRRHPELTGKVEYTQKTLTEYPENTFDYIVSKDAFEHVIGLECVIRDIRRCLKKGGKLYAGFGPLYNSFDGHHGCFGPMIPWGHLMLSEAVLVAKANRRVPQRIVSIHDLLLNQMSYREYRSVLCNSGLKVLRFEVNRSKHAVSALFSLLRRLPFLEEYMSHNIYCVLQKQDSIVEA